MAKQEGQKLKLLYRPKKLKYRPFYRPKQVSVEAIDINGEPFTETLEGFVARIVMHETDHLNGILYIDKMEMPKNPKKFQTSLERIKRRYHVVP